MLKANEIVAWDLTEKGKFLTYRVHDEPAEENLRRFFPSCSRFRIPRYRLSKNLKISKNCSKKQVKLPTPITWHRAISVECALLPILQKI